MSYIVVLVFEDKIEWDLCLEQIRDDTIIEVTERPGEFLATGKGLGHVVEMAFVPEQEDDGYSAHTNPY